jgi:hypothetical protein
MVKVIAYSVVAVLLVASTASAQIGTLYQSENVINGLGSTVALSGAPGTGGSLGVVANFAGQTASTTLPTSASQGIGLLGVQASFVQNDGSAVISVGQTLGIQGAAAGSNGPGQVQLIAADVGATAGGEQQFQGIALTGTQTITKAGDGTAVGLNAGGTILGQEVANASTTADQGILIIGGQLSGASGDAASLATITTSMTATVLQYQSGNVAHP